MEHCLERDRKYRPVLKVVILIYALTGIYLTVMGAVHRSGYEFFVSMGTLLVIPALWAIRKIFHLQGGWQLETYVYVFTYLGWTLGGAAMFYDRFPGFDKVVHCLSGIFVPVAALSGYRFLERKHSKEGENPATACFFVFFASMAVAGLFELCEFTLAPVMGRDLQHVLDSGVTDTMTDMGVCLLGTVVFVVLMIRSAHGKHDPFTDAAESFAYQNLESDKIKNK